MEVKGIPKIITKGIFGLPLHKTEFLASSGGSYSLLDAKEILKKSKLNNNCLITIKLLIVIVF